MSFTCSEFPGRTFGTVKELEELREEKKALREHLLIQKTSTFVEKEEPSGNSEHGDRKQGSN